MRNGVWRSLGRPPWADVCRCCDELQSDILLEIATLTLSAARTTRSYEKRSAVRLGCLIVQAACELAWLWLEHAAGVLVEARTRQAQAHWTSDLIDAAVMTAIECVGGFAPSALLVASPWRAGECDVRRDTRARGPVWTVLGLKVVHIAAQYVATRQLGRHYEAALTEALSERRGEPLPLVAAERVDQLLAEDAR